MLLALPDEVVLAIFQYLQTSDILSLRQTCTHLAEITKDKFIWVNLLQSQRGRLPLPLGARQNDEAEKWSAEALETLSPPVKLEERRGELLIGLEILLDRWIVAVYADGYVNLWDANEQVAQQQWSFVHTGNEKISSFQAVVHDSGTKLMVAGTKVHLRGEWKVALYEVQLSDPALEFTLVCIFPTSPSKSVRQLYPPGRIVAFSQLGSIDLVRWPEDLEGDTQSVSIVNPQFDELEEMFTTILSLRCLDKHIFVFKTRSIELHPLPDFDSDSKARSPSPLPLALRHNFPSYNFREVRISEVEAEERPAERYQRYTLRMLASDIIQGLFYFVVDVTVPYGYLESPLLDIHLTAIYAMTTHIPLPVRPARSRGDKHFRSERISRPIFDSPPSTRGPSSIRPREMFESRAMSRSGPGSGSGSGSDRDPSRTSSFVSTYAMGSQGMRAFWVERRRGTTLKQIVSCQLWPPPAPVSLSPSPPSPDLASDRTPSARAAESERGLGLEEEEEDSNVDEGDLDGDGDGSYFPWAIDGQTVYSIQSYDLREDVTYCALGEVSGKMVLGNRSGDVFLLETGV
ncbi:hypothetical protein GYMLUDRAFT_89152 [Collybiopsis luxurians FD-317 M1]|uniref:F-box domain-containing protein n=1 Tax=Collybiopsis luxurians FD-317 M1 TaxID=944289 RepID=A0A0D0B9Z5_9AGAR|nr:hypothetical protein GYMLUDRAFT_89152 [Collybiopsis luxurians FD-317 M1]